MAPKKPPPFVPKCLIDSKEATGPIAICWVCPSSVVTSSEGLSVCGTCRPTSTNETSRASGMNTRICALTKSSKKFPTDFWPVIPLTKATATENPLAADVNIIIVITAICEKYESPVSPL
ncbi:hypothetical protein D3C76_1395270 [compost metagenome]